MFDEIASRNVFEVSQLLSKDTINHPIVVSQITDQNVLSKPISSFSKIDKKNEEVLKVRFNVTATVDSVKILNKTTKVLSDCSSANVKLQKD